MDLSAGRITDVYAPLFLNALFGILNNRFSYLWNPVLECISVLVSIHFSLVWDIFINYLERCQAIRETSSNIHGSANGASVDQQTGMFQLHCHHILSSSFVLSICFCGHDFLCHKLTLMYILLFFGWCLKLSLIY